MLKPDYTTLKQDKEYLVQMPNYKWLVMWWNGTGEFRPTNITKDIAPVTHYQDAIQIKELPY